MLFLPPAAIRQLVVRLRRSRAILPVFFCFLALNIQAQDLGTWNIFNVAYKISDRWGLFGEAQVRSLQMYNDFHYYEYKGGFHYSGIKNARIGLAVGRYVTYTEGGDFTLPKNNDEFRVWPHVTLLQTAGRFRIEQRYRAEMRFTSSGYRNRLRYRVAVSYPFSLGGGSEKPWSVYVNNEIFLSDLQPHFQRNRFAAGMNFRTSPNAFILLGYLNQYDFRQDRPSVRRGFMQVGWYMEFARKSADRQ